MRHGSLFSGIGGFDLAAQWMGWENIFHCEWNPFGQQVLKYYWPSADSHTDITKTDFTPYANRIDVLTGGFPCQPYSTAGKRLGKEDERHLWPEMLRAVREISPRYVVGENVRGLISWNGGLVFDEVQADLEAAGYEVLPFLLPACGVNAPHERYRIWFIAHSKNGLHQGNEREFSKTNGRQEQHNLSALRKSSDRLCEQRINPNAKNGGRDVASIKKSGEHKTSQEQVGGLCGNGVTADTGSTGRKECNTSAFANRQEFSSRVSPDTWTNWPTQSPLCAGNDGIPSGLDTATISFSKWRNESIKAGGNAIVPQVAFQLFKAIAQYEGGAA